MYLIEILAEGGTTRQLVSLRLQTSAEINGRSDRKIFVVNY